MLAEGHNPSLAADGLRKSSLLFAYSGQVSEHLGTICDFPRWLQANARIFTSVTPRPFPPKSFPARHVPLLTACESSPQKQRLDRDGMVLISCRSQYLQICRVASSRVPALFSLMIVVTSNRGISVASEMCPASLRFKLYV
jgi:hypothetical protein